jgi:acyl-CoA reductase-like NAD-dependent aldehyde dehydrogenase
MPVVTVIAAGNRVMLKPSKFAPATNAVLASMTVADIVFGKLLSGGQTCIAPDYALVHQSEIDTFIESYDRLVKAAYPDGPTARRARTTPRSSTTRSTRSAPS